MVKISPAIRISFGLVMFTLSVILIADLFGVVPKKESIVLDARKKVSEILAVQLSVAVSRSEFDIVNSSLEHFVERNVEVLAASMSRVDGTQVAKFGEFVNYHEDIDMEETGEARSTDNIVIVPVFSGAERWGSVNVEFRSVFSGTILSYLRNSIFGILLFVAFGCFLGYMFILKKALKVLDPKGVVPDRVRAAFNTLSEGVLIVDNKEQIIMANDAFAEKVDQDADDLLGVEASSMKWKHASKELSESKTKMPWAEAIKGGANKIGVSLNLSTQHAGVRTLSTNAAPITDDNGHSRGALITFDDVTDVQETNVKLENTVSTLTKSEAEVKRKNVELEVLATRDPLTGCYNRRAFFDLFEKAIEEADKSGMALSCIMLDIDHFKVINDSFGHSIGDEAIRLIADILHNNCDNNNAVVGRYGGEEFCIFLPGCEIDEANSIAEHLRQTIQTESNGFCMENVFITCSFGVADKTAEMHECSKLLECSDAALYIAKDSGRNKVVNWTPESEKEGVDDVVSLGDTHKATTNNIVSNAKITMLESTIENLQKKLDEQGDQDALNEARSVDPITKLPSKLIFLDRVDQAIAYNIRNKSLMAVATLNIDFFSRISDTMGQDVSEEFLREVGHRLKNILRRSDTVASMLSPGQSGPIFSRLVDDEFALLLSGLDDIASLTYVIKRIQNKFAGNLKVGDKEMYLTSSIGISVSPTDGQTAEELIENARRAKKQAKTLSGRNNYQYYSQVDNRMIIDQMQVEIELRNAIERDEFILHYQPKVDLKSGRISSMEALIRWQHPTKGLVYPDAFISIAEKTGMIQDIGKWCLQSACKQTKQWVEMGARNIRTAVNISAQEFGDEDFKDNVLSALKNTGLSARHLEIEITESTIIADQESTHKLIDELRFQGITMTLDDFGTGYSSLSYFGNLDLDWLKLDRSFLLEAMDNERSQTIYASVVKMVHATGVKVVSEGIETQEQYAYIKKLNIDEMQGYLIGKPGAADLVTELLFPDLQKKYNS